MIKLHNLQTAFFSLGILFLVGACNTTTEEPQTKVIEDTQLPYYDEAYFTPNWLSPKSDSLKDFHQIRPFNLVNQEGKNLTEKDFANKIYIADFFFTSCPGICPKMTANMSVLQEAFLDEEDVLLISHSVTPEMDSVSVLLDYAKDKNVDPSKWHLVTGERSEIYDLGRNYYFVEEDLGIEKSTDDFLHTENFVLIDQNRHIRGIYSGLNKVAVQQLIKDVKVLLNETSS